MTRRRKKRKQSNIVRFRRSRFQFDVGTVLFGLVFVYILVSVVLYFTKSHIKAYEVKNGTITEEHSYTGIALRNEKIFYSEDAGNVNFYIKEGSRVGVKTLVYTIDENGKTTELLANDSADGTTFSTEDWTEIQHYLYNYSTDNYSEMRFSSVYDLKNNLNGIVMELLNQSLLSTMDASVQNGSLKGFFAKESGIIVFSMDGYENLTPETITKETFDEPNYKKESISNSDLVGNGDPVYKLIMDENWDIVIPLTDAQYKRLSDEQYNENYIRIRFSKDRTEANAYVTLMDSGDEKYAKLSFSNSVVRFAGERFIHIELLLDGISGLKIPTSSILEKEFYLVPEDYISRDNPNYPACVYVDKTDKDGNAILETRPVDIYKTTDDGCYLAKNVLSAGESLRKTDNSEERYVVGKTATLIGVYNINKGYCIFRSINILSKNSEYSIVESDSAYGLSEYDHIVLDATTANEAEIIY